MNEIEYKYWLMAQIIGTRDDEKVLCRVGGYIPEHITLPEHLFPAELKEEGTFVYVGLGKLNGEWTIVIKEVEEEKLKAAT